MSSYALSLLLAVIACVIGGGMGGYALARPRSVLGLADLSLEGGRAAAAAIEGRAYGGLLVAAHAAAALMLGYHSSVGAIMAFALAIAWFGAAGGRGLALLLDRANARASLGTLAFEVLIGLTLALPYFNEGRLRHGPGMWA